MKILYSCLSESWGGMEMFTLRAVDQLIKRNIATELLCFPGSKIHTEAERIGIITHCLKAKGYFHPFQILKLKNILRNSSYYLIHTQASKDLWVIVPALKLSSSNIPLIMTKQVGSFIAKKDRLHKWIYDRVDLVFAISRVIKKNLLDTCPLTEDKIELMHNGVDINKFNPQKVDLKKVRNEFNIHDDDLVIGMIARFSWGKGHEEFLFAAKELLQDCSNLKFLIVGEPSRGEDEYAKKIKNLAAEYGIQNDIIFTGFRKDTPEILAAMDIFVFPSHSEAFGIALVEAMAMGKPSVCSDSDGILDIAVNDVTSYLFQKQNSKDLTKKLKLLINSPEQRKNFSEAARNRAIEMFDMEILTSNVISCYEQLIQRKK
jgi:glycosyltransferase involved in cell wall biosynthesis